MVVGSILGVKSPKNPIFLWLAFEKKALTWEFLQKRCKQAPRICLLYRMEEETIAHPVIKCPCAQQIWAGAEQLTGNKNGQGRETVEECFKGWCSKSELKEFKALPCLLLWGFG